MALFKIQFTLLESNYIHKGHFVTIASDLQEARDQFRLYILEQKYPGDIKIETEIELSYGCGIICTDCVLSRL